MSKKAFSEKSDRSDPVATSRLIRYRKNMQVQKKNRLKRTSEARVMAVWISFFLFSSYFYSPKNEQKAFFEKSARSNRLKAVWLRGYRKNTQVQKKNRLKRTSEARVMAVWNFLNSRPPFNLWEFFSNGRNFRLERRFGAILFLIPRIFARSIWKTHPPSLNFPFTFSSYFSE